MALDVNNINNNVAKQAAPKKEKKQKEKNQTIIKKDRGHLVRNLIIFVVVLLILGIGAFIAYNKIFNTVEEVKYSKMHLVINDKECTNVLKHDVFIDKDAVYLSRADISNFYDGEIYYDSDYDQVVTASDTKLAVMPVDSEIIFINGEERKINATVVKKGENYFIPFSEIAEEVFDTEVKYIEASNVVVMTSLDKKQTLAKANSNIVVKKNPKFLSKAADKLEKDEEVSIARKDNENLNGWVKITTPRGKVGYVKEGSLGEYNTVREDKVIEKQIEGNVSLVWDYYSEFVKAPSRSGKIEGVNVVSPSFFYLQDEGEGNIIQNVNEGGEEYIKWAHKNGYKVWPILSNNSYKDTTSKILRDFKLRQRLIDTIILAVTIYDVDGINIDFENIYKNDKDYFTKFIMELKPRLASLGKTLTVDVTAPDGADDWSLCYDRYKIAKLADYIIFMGYDEYSQNSTKAGPTSSYNWLELNVKKFLGQEEVPAEKLILGLPFYTRIWTENGDRLSSDVISMNATPSRLSGDIDIVWLEEERQNYAEFEERGSIKKIWIEDERSFKEKLSLVKEHNLAGAAYWVKDREDPNIWNVIKEELEIE